MIVWNNENLFFNLMQAPTVFWSKAPHDSRQTIRQELQPWTLCKTLHAQQTYQHPFYYGISYTYQAYGVQRCVGKALTSSAAQFTHFQLLVLLLITMDYPQISNIKHKLPCMPTSGPRARSRPTPGAWPTDQLLPQISFPGTARPPPALWGTTVASRAARPAAPTIASVWWITAVRRVSAPVSVIIPAPTFISVEQQTRLVLAQIIILGNIHKTWTSESHYSKSLSSPKNI